ncbi:MAG: hypothetical protein PGN13_14640 [Patulibacter minatonensis]
MTLSPEEAPAAPFLTRRAMLLPGLAVVFGVLLTLYLNRSTWFYLDDWDFVVLRADWSQGALLGPQNLNWVMTTDIVYTLLGRVFGVSTYVPWRIVAAIALGVVGWQIGRYAAPRVGRVIAAVAVLAVFITPGWEISLWPFQMGQLLALAAGLGAILLVDHRSERTWRRELALVALLVFAVTSSSAGIPLLGMFIVDRLLRPGRRRDVLVALPALVLYAWWNQKWGSLSPNLPASNLESFLAATRQAIEVAMAALQSMLGLQDHTAIGGFLSVVALLGLVVVATWRLLTGHAPDRARILAIVAGLAAYWVLLAWGRSSVPGYETSPRYLFFSQVLLVLLVVELVGRTAAERLAEPARERRVAVGLGVLATLGLAVGMIGNLSSLRSGSVYLRNEGQHQEAQYAALSLLPQPTRAAAPLYRGAHDYVLPMAAGAYFDHPGPPKMPVRSEAEVRDLPAATRGFVDRYLLLLRSVEVPAGQPRGVPAEPRPELVAAPGTAVKRVGRSCVAVNGPRAAYPLNLATGASVEIENTGTEPVELRGRRYADTLTGSVPVAIGPGAVRRLTNPPDLGKAPWTFEITASRAHLCSTEG